MAHTGRSVLVVEKKKTTDTPEVYWFEALLEFRLPFCLCTCVETSSKKKIVILSTCSFIAEPRGGVRESCLNSRDNWMRCWWRVGGLWEGGLIFHILPRTYNVHQTVERALNEESLTGKSHGSGTRWSFRSSESLVTSLPSQLLGSVGVLAPGSGATIVVTRLLPAHCAHHCWLTACSFFLHFFVLLVSTYSWLLPSLGFCLLVDLAFCLYSGCLLSDFHFLKKDDLIGKSVTATSIRHDHWAWLGFFLEGGQEGQCHSKIDSFLVQLA